jgi:hypothetical protein
MGVHDASQYVVVSGEVVAGHLHSHTSGLEKNCVSPMSYSITTYHRVTAILSSTTAISLVIY